MSMTADYEARRKAVTSIDKSIMVEAGAGVGKTSVLAARIANMLASGVNPKAIAAVTFTEAAASELLGRVRKFVNIAVNHKDGTKIDTELEAVFPDNIVSKEQRANLEKARRSIGALTITTIHGFCQRLIKPYPVEANIDPGATIIAGLDATLMFDDVFDKWVRERLSADNSDLITSMIMTDASKAITTIRTVADALRGSPDTVVAEARVDTSISGPFMAAAMRFLVWHNNLSYGKSIEGHVEIVNAFRTMHTAVASLDVTKPHIAIMDIVAMGLDNTVFKIGDGLAKQYRVKTKFVKAAGNKTVGEADFDAANELYTACCESFLAMREAFASAAIHMLANEIRPLLDTFQAHKRAAASLDFDDLLNSALSMLKTYPEVRKALGNRYRHILVDEYQDTDPVQTAIFMHLAFEQDELGNFTTPKPGALFMVGDPKQAIYRFRGADVATYVAMRELMRAFDPESVLYIFVNFRSQEPILTHVNTTFEPLLNVKGQPGFQPLSAYHTAVDTSGLPAVAWFAPQVHDADEANIAEWRKAEAHSIAEICQSLIGNYEGRGRNGGEGRPCQPGDIALLVPQGTELYLYENALEALGIPISTQAGKGMYRQQEVQDMIAITRVLADERDTLALGALLRGPLFGFTEQELLDQSHLIPSHEDGRFNFLRLGMDTSVLTNEQLKATISTLTSLRNKAHIVSPHDILSEAVTRLMVRPKVRARFKSSPERRLANVDRFLEMSTTYDVRGLRAFSDAVRASWEDGERTTEGRPDQNDDAVNFITMHSAKGLEWPIVIPINTMTALPPPGSMVKNVGRNTLTLPFFGIKPVGYATEVTAADAEERFERFRLWYVAMTRAKSLLMLPYFENIQSRGESWAELLNLKVESLPKVDLTALAAKPRKASPQSTNKETAEAFAAVSASIAERQKPRLEWVTPSKHELSAGMSSRLSMDEIMTSKPDLDPYANIVGGAERGNILHKLMEEILTGELNDAPAQIEARSLELIEQVVAKDMRKIKELYPQELTRCVTNTLALESIVAIRPRLIPELSTATRMDVDGKIKITYGIMDAAEVAQRDDDPGKADIRLIVDWKSDMRPSPSAINGYIEQVRRYLETKDIAKGLIVFMSTGMIVEVTADSHNVRHESLAA
jgi:exodeoxyribonuclease-5